MKNLKKQKEVSAELLADFAKLSIVDEPEKTTTTTTTETETASGKKEV